MDLHDFLDCNYGPDGDSVLRRKLAGGADPHARAGGETPLHVAVRRRRAMAVAILLDHGAEVDATNGHGKTGYAHAARRGFADVAALLAERGAKTTLNDADRFAVAVMQGQLDAARKLLAEFPAVACTGNPEEDRLLADLAGRNDAESVAFLIAAGADLAARGLDSGTPLHQAAWFGQPANASLLIEAGAPVNDFDAVHQSSPLGWAVHGSRYSGGADQRQDTYVQLVRSLLDAGSILHYPDDPTSEAYRNRLLDDSTPRVRECLEQAT